MRYLLLMVSCVLVTGCTRSAAPATPQEVAEQETRMRQFLKDSSPRATNQMPKAVDEFTQDFKTGTNKKSEAQ